MAGKYRPQGTFQLGNSVAHSTLRYVKNSRISGVSARCGPAVAFGSTSRVGSEEPPMASDSAGNVWKPIAIILAVLLGVVLVFTALLVSGLVDLGFSLF
jgi:hypothetical protein